MNSWVYNWGLAANVFQSERAASLADTLFGVSARLRAWVCACICVCVLIHGGESNTVSLPGWQAALSPSSEWKPIWQITSSRQSAHPPLLWRPLLALSWSLSLSLVLLVLFVWHLSRPLPRAWLTLPHAHIHKSPRLHVTCAPYFCLPGRNGRSKLSIFMSQALQVNCLRDSAVMNIRFETRGEEG